MKKLANSEVQTEEQAEVEEPKVHPMLKSHMFISKKHVEYNNLDAFEAVSMATVFILAVFVGVIYSTMLV